MEKKQKIIFGWGLVFLLIIPAIFIMVFFLDNQTSVENIENNKPTVEYSVLPRNASDSALSNIEKYNVLGGTMNDEAKGCLKLGKSIFIIGETDSNDNDFKANQKSIFIAEISTGGVLKKTISFAENCSYLQCALCNFKEDAKIIILAENGENNYIYSVKVDLTMDLSTELPLNYTSTLNTITNGFTVTSDCYDKNFGYSVETVAYNEKLQEISRQTVTQNKYNRHIIKTSSITNGIAVLTSTQNGEESELTIKLFTIKDDLQFINEKSYKKNAKNLKALQLERSNLDNFMILYLNGSSISYLSIDSECNVISDTGEKNYSAVKHSIGEATSGTIFPIYNYENNVAFEISGYFVFGYNNEKTTCDLITHDGIALEKNIGEFYNCGEILQYVSSPEDYIFMMKSSSTKIVTLDRNRKIVSSVDFDSNTVSNPIALTGCGNKLGLIANINNTNKFNPFGKTDVLFALIRTNQK